MPTKSAAGLVNALKLLAVMPAAGAGIGGLIGAARAEKGKRLRTALGDAGVGGMAGLGFALGGTAGGAAGMAMGGKNQAAADNQSAALGGAGSALGAVGAGMLGQKLRQEMEEEYDIGNNPLSVVGKIGSHEDNVNPYHTAGIGAGAGALIGALTAPKGKMLKYTLGGAGIGGLSGGMSGVGWNFGNNSLGEDLSPLRLPIAIGGGALGAHLGNKMYDEVEEHIPEKKDKKKKDTDMKKTEKKAALPDTLEGFRHGLTDIAPKFLPSATIAGLLGGGLYGGVTGTGAVRNAVRGGLIGAGAGLGAGVGTGTGFGAAMDTQRLISGEPKNFVEGVDRFNNNVFYGGTPGLAAGGIGGGFAGNELFKMIERNMGRDQDKKKDKEPKSEKKSADDWKGVDLAKNPINWTRTLPKADATARNWKPAPKAVPASQQKHPPMVPVKASSALSFGEKCAAGFDWKSIMNTGLGGAALGAGVGGLAGLIAPGEDGEGRRRGRLSGALRGAMGGGLLGGGAGAIGEAASPGFGSTAYNYAGDLYKQLFGRSQQSKPLPRPGYNDFIRAMKTDVTGDNFKSMMEQYPSIQYEGAEQSQIRPGAV